MASIKDRLSKLRNEAKERSRQLSQQKDLTANSQQLSLSHSHSSGEGLTNLTSEKENVKVSSSIATVSASTAANNVHSISSRSNNTSHSHTRRIMINGKLYNLLNKLGRGGSSLVYQAFSESDGQCVAIKCVDLTNTEEEVRKAYDNEIELLKSLQGSPYVIKMFNYERRNNKLYVVMERGDVDLATFMQKRSEQIDAKFIKYHWQEMLRCVKVIHDRNVVHSDLKPANFLFVGASLKLIDFGIASSIPSNKTSVMKDVLIGTINYMSPEAICGCYSQDDGQQVYKIPLKSDVWSLGCILYAMVYGRTPFQHLPNQIAKTQAISSPNYRIEFPPIKDQLLLDVMQRCLVRNVKERASIDELLAHPYLKE